MQDKYDLNPCKACLDKYKRGKCDINNLNNCCYDTLTAFSGNYSVDGVRRTPQAQNCVQCLKNAMRTLGPFGRTFCDLRLAPPPVFQQYPHYLPDLLQKGDTPDNALRKCLSMCDSSTYPVECAENCITDRNAVVPVEVENFSSEGKSAVEYIVIVFVVFILFAGLRYYYKK